MSTSKLEDDNPQNHVSDSVDVLPKDPPASVESKKTGKQLYPVSDLATAPWAHAAAEALHNWKLAGHHTGSEMKLSKEDYESAIKAASKRVEGKYKPCKAALFTLPNKGR